MCVSECLFSHVWLFASPWTITCQVLSMGFSRQEYWSGGDLPHPGAEPASPALQAYSLPLAPPGKPRAFQLNIITDNVGLTSTILIFVFYMSYIIFIPQILHYCLLLVKEVFLVHLIQFPDHFFSYLFFSYFLSGCPGYCNWQFIRI